MIKLLSQFTEDCNLRCRHCHDSCGKGRTMSDENIERVLNNLPLLTLAFEITGGEPFVRREKLFHMLEYIRHNAAVLPIADIAVQTNAFWAKDEGAVCDTLEELAGLGVDILEITSMDKYHAEQGLDTSGLEMKFGSRFYNGTMKFAEKHKAELRIKEDSCGDVETRIVKPGLLEPKAMHLVYGCIKAGKQIPDRLLLERDIIEIIHTGAKGGAVPFGRAKELPETEIRKRTRCGYAPKTKEDMTLSIAADGLVYPCCWKVTAPLGSAIERPVREIMRNARKDKVMGALLRGGPEAAARVMGMYNPKDDSFYHRTPCTICEEIFRGYR